MAVALGRVLIAVALWVGILVGIREALGALIPQQWCGGTPIDLFAYIIGFMLSLNTIPDKLDLTPLLRKATVMAAGLIVAALAARVIAGCTPLAAWLYDLRFAVEVFVLLAFLVPLAYFHRAVVEPKWARAMGETSEGSKGQS